MKKVLVTGGKGFLGSYLVNRLQSEGCEMRILARPHHDTPKSELNDPSIIWVMCATAR